LKNRTKTGKYATANYIPTKKEEALLRVLLDPFHRMSTVSQICKLAPCSRDFYYSVMKKPEFAVYYRQVCIDLTKQRAGQLINIGFREARKGGSQGLGYWKELMKMSGLLEDDKVKVEHTGEMLIRFVDPTNDLDLFMDDE
jgi:hypothetical protein